MLKRTVILMLLAGSSIFPVSGQQGRPGQNGGVAGYVYPSGGCRNTELEVEVGGAALGGTRGVRISGTGVSAVVLKHFKPLNNMVENKIREILKAEREKITRSSMAAKDKKGARGGKGGGIRP